MVKSFTVLTYCTIVMLCCLTTVVWSQSRTISGTVTSGDEKLPMPGVSILEKGTPNGVISDANGNFTIQVTSESPVLVISFVGYASQEISVSNHTSVSITMQPDVANLDEVVIIGYGTVKKSDATGAVAVVGSGNFNRGVVNSPQELILGKVPGVSITSISGAPGQTSTIRIRGGSSLNASNNPLIVIDGVPITNSEYGGSPNILSTLNPSEIETFTVLKDASATAIYGLRASNGVIIVTTKRGGKGFKINYKVTATVYTTPKKVDVYNGDEFRNLINQQYADSPAVTGLLGTDNTDWQDEIYQNSVGIDHNLNFSGTVLKNVPYRVAFGYNNTDGVLKTYNFERTTATLGLDPSFFNNSLKASINVKGMINNNNFADQGAIGDAIAYDPTKPVHNGNVRWRGYTTWTNPGEGIDGTAISLAPANPLARLQLTDNTSKVKRSIGNIKLDYTVPFVTGLTATLNMGYDVAKTEGHNNVQDSTQWIYEPTVSGGRYNPYSSKVNNTLLDFYLNYKKDFKSIESNIDFTGGYSYAYFHSMGGDSTMNKYQEQPAVRVNAYETDNALLSFFGRLNYTYKDRYLLTATLRADATSRFSKDEGRRWGMFPALAFAWKLKEEQFLKSVEALSDLKLRLGYGVTGQQDVSSDYPYIPTYTRSDDAARYNFGGVFYNTLRPDAYDANIRWEQTAMINAAIDYGFMQNKFTGSIDVYRSESSDLIAVIPVPAGTNFSSVLLTNTGGITNTGIEFSLNAELLSRGDWHWEAGYNITYNKNEITRLNLSDNPNTIVQLGGIGGTTSGTIQAQKVGYARGTFYVYKQIYDSEGNPIEDVYADLNNDGIINTSDLYLHKKPDATVYMGINSRVTYKDWDFSFSGRASFGNYVYNNVASNSTYAALYSSMGFLRNMSTLADDTKFTTALNTRFSDYYVENASFFRMDNINLGYTFGSLYKEKLSVRLGLGVQNVFVITKYSGLDPEVSGGIDNNFFPRTRAFLLNLNCTF